MGAQVAAVELHALDHVDGRLERLSFLDGDDAVGADLFKRVGELFADRLVVVGGDRRDLGDLFLAGNLLGLRLDLLDHGQHGLVDAALERHRVGPGGERLESLFIDRLGQHGRGRGAVARGVGGLGRRFLHELRTHVLIGIGQLDFLGHRHAVLGDGRAAPALVDHGITATRAKRGTNGPRQLRHPTGQLLAGLLIVGQNFRHGGSPWS